MFFGTTNHHEFLKDTTGNRSFWPIQVGVIKPTKNVFRDLEGEVDNLWAEAVAYFRQGESLIIEDNEAILILANEAREAHREGNAKAGVIEEFLKRKIPPSWNTMSVDARRMFLRSTTVDPSQELTYRDRICAAEVWCECFDKELSWMRKADTRELNQILESLSFTQRFEKVRKFGAYGDQRGFQLMLKNE